MNAPGMKLTFHQRFADKYIPEPNSGCWLWLGNTNENGYGIIDIKIKGFRKVVGAHRISYEIHKGEVPSDLNVCHVCDTPACVNPDHLFLGTDMDNHLDAVRKGRVKKITPMLGAAHARALLSEDDILGIRLSNESLKVLSERYNISQPSISSIRTGRSWKSVHAHLIPEKKIRVRTQKQIAHAEYERARMARKRSGRNGGTP